MPYSLHSSWNPDRIAAAHCNRNAGKRPAASRRPNPLMTHYKKNGKTVEVLTRRGRVVCTLTFDSAITSASIADDRLEVVTARGSRFVCDARTGRVLSEWAPAEPAATAHPYRLPRTLPDPDMRKAG